MSLTVTPSHGWRLFRFSTTPSDYRTSTCRDKPSIRCCALKRVLWTAQYCNRVLLFCGGMATAVDTFDGCMTPDPTRLRLRGETKRKKPDRGDRAPAKRPPRCSLQRSASIGSKTFLPKRLPRLAIAHSSFATATAGMN